MPLPITNKMPKLKVDRKLVNDFLLCQLIGAGIGTDKKFEQYRTNYVRLVDKAIHEYNSVREAVTCQIEDKKRGIFILPIINHMENCINATNRANKILKRIISNPGNGFDFDRAAKRMVDSYINNAGISDLRNTIEHIEECILNDEIQNDEKVALDISEDASKIIIADKVLEINDLATLLKKLHEIGYEIAIYNVPDMKEREFKLLKLKAR